MARPLRIEYPGAWYHVMNRGRRGEKIFWSDKDYEMFLAVLKETVAMWNLELSAFCLMSNHYHLLVHIPDGNLARCMRHLNGVYTQRFNRRHKIDGHLFRGRYRAVLIDADSYLLEVLRYIHRNPLRAGIVEALGNYQWSSHKGYVSRAKRWDWLYKDFLLSMFAEKKSQALKAYLDFVCRGESAEIERFYSLKNLPSVLGGEAFKDWIKQKFQHLSFQQEIPDSRELGQEPDRIIELVCDHFGISREQMMVSRRGRENLPRDV
ncbi:MAG: transposase, partial [Desulfoferrobacter sp.]